MSGYYSKKEQKLGELKQRFNLIIVKGKPLKFVFKLGLDFGQ